MGRPKQKAKRIHGDEGTTPPGVVFAGENRSTSPPDVSSSKSRKSMTPPPRTPTTASTKSEPVTPVTPAMPVQLSPGGPFIVPNDGELRCDFCLLTAACNRKGLAEDLLFCKDCQAKAHPSCMDYSEDLAQRARTSPWQCIDCKTCYICEDSGDPDAMLFCDACDKGYHMDCHNPPVEDKPTGKWVCSKCVLELELTESQMELDMDREVSRDSVSTSTTDGPACLPTPGDSPVPMQEVSPDQNANTVKADSYASRVRDKKEPPKILSPVPMMNGHINPPLPRLSETLPIEVPDASDWSIDDVVAYFRQVGFVEQAEVFKEQEIDGKSLLLMKRSDVLTGLSLKLGPALKIFTHIQRLQTMGPNSTR